MPKSKEFNKEYWLEGEGLNEIKEWLEQGLTDGTIAKNIGISQQTLIK